MPRFLALTGLVLVVAFPAASRAADALLAIPFGPRVAERISRAGAQVEERGSGVFLVRANAAAQARLHQDGVAGDTLAADADAWFHHQALQSWEQHKFPSWPAVIQELETLALERPELVQLETLGRSGDGRPLLAAKVGHDPRLGKPVPAVRVMGVHHGNEAMGAVMCLRLLRRLVEQDGVDPAVTALLERVNTWILPVVNPDGYAALERRNARGVDLNRNYGFMWAPGESNGLGPYSEEETWALHQWAQRERFLLSLSFHTAAAYVNFPWNHSRRATPDEPLLQVLAQEYADQSGYQAVNGYDWYQVTGDADDHLYGTLGGLELTIETSDEDEDAVWDANRDAMLTFLAHAREAVAGRVRDPQGRPVAAWIWAEGQGWPGPTRPRHGDFYRLLPAGASVVRVEANGFLPAQVTLEPPVANTVDITLTPGPGLNAHALAAMDYWDTEDRDTVTEPLEVLGAPDGLTHAVPPARSVVLDLGPETRLPFPGALAVHTARASRCRYDVAVATTARGSWWPLGTFVGAAHVPLRAGLPAATRFVRIHTEDTPLDLDALEVVAGTFPTDAGMPDSGTVDASVPDAGTVDASVPDAGSVDASVPDAHAEDAARAEVDASVQDGDADGESSAPCACTSSSGRNPWALLVLALGCALRLRRARPQGPLRGQALHGPKDAQALLEGPQGTLARQHAKITV